MLRNQQLQQQGRHGPTLQANNANPTSDEPAGAHSSGPAGSQPAGQKYLNDCRSFYSCIYCRTHLANHDELVSRSFQGNRSRAYLFNSVVNVACGPAVQRELNTGSHAVADVFCSNCGTTIGWKYERAYVDSQRYKEGKFIIELVHVVRENRHLELDRRDRLLGLASALPSIQRQPAAGSASGSLSPDSGQWSPGGSSSSSSSPETSEAPTCCFFDHLPPPASTRDESEPEDEEEEILMFPFFDELYGDRSSYSNLSTSRGYQRRLKRTLYLEASPYDWKYARSPTSSLADELTGRQPAPSLTSSSSSESIAIPPAQTAGQKQPTQVKSQAHEIEKSTAGGIARRQPAGEYLTGRVRPSLLYPAAFGLAVRRRLSGELGERAYGPLPPAAASSAMLADNRETQFEFEHDCRTTTSNVDERDKSRPALDAKQQELDCDCPPTSDTSAGHQATPMAGEGSSSGSSASSSFVLSLDDEEFYECCSGHEVANLSDAQVEGSQ